MLQLTHTLTVTQYFSRSDRGHNPPCLIVSCSLYEHPKYTPSVGQLQKDRVKTMTLNFLFNHDVV